MTLVDSNILIDVFQSDARWLTWSLQSLRAASLAGPLAINAIVYSEISSSFNSVNEIDDALASIRVRFLPIPKEAAFAAALAFRAYRSRGGAKTNVLPDFLIGGHALASGLTLLTRDATRYRTYFPNVELIAP